MHDNRHEPTYQDLLDRIAVLEARTQRLSVSPNGYLTRPALEILLESINDRLYSPDSSLVFLGWDIDGMKQCNSTWGEPGTNQRLSSVRHHPTIRAIDIGTVWSGDEYMAVVESSDALGLATRLQEIMHQNDLSATFIILDPRDYTDWCSAIDAQRELCGVHKSRNERDSIHDYR